MQRSRFGKVLTLGTAALAVVFVALVAMIWTSAPQDTAYAAGASNAALTATASGTVTAGRFVKLTAANTIASATACTDMVVGVCEFTAATTTLTRYAPVGTVTTVTSGEACAVGDLLTAGALGKAFKVGTTYATTQRYGAIALTAAGAADVSVTCIVVAGATPALTTMPSATVAATGSTQAHAIASGLMTTGFTLVSGADATKGVALPVAAAGLICVVKNNAAAVLKVWPNTGDAINAIAGDTNIAMASLTSCIFVAYDATTWYTIPLLPS
jgi:hypothetical protein